MLGINDTPEPKTEETPIQVALDKLDAAVAALEKRIADLEQHLVTAVEYAAARTFAESCGPVDEQSPEFNLTVDIDDPEQATKLRADHNAGKHKEKNPNCVRCK